MLLAVALGAVACNFKPGAPAAPGDVVLWGDSFGETVAPYLPYVERVYGGTAPCDWLDEIRESPAPQTAVLLFVGNKLADRTCDYPNAVAAITQSLRSRGARVVWVAAPYLPIFPGARSILNAIYPNPAHGPADAIGGDVLRLEYRNPDRNHLNVTGAKLFAQKIQGVVG